MKKLLVLSTPHPSDPHPNETVSLLVQSFESHIETKPFSYKYSITGKFDLLHVHWPESLVRGQGALQTILRQLLFVLLVAKIRLFLIPVVWTVHNENPHEPGGCIESWLLRVFSKSVKSRVFMFQTALPRQPLPGDCVIRRGDYSQVYPLSTHRRDDKVHHGALLIAGQIRPYKGIDEFLQTFRALQGCGLQLSIVGEAKNAAYLAKLVAVAKGMDGVDFKIGFLDSDNLEKQFLKSEVVVLPYKKSYNSGVALLALTLKRPVIVQDSATMQELATEVGGNWVTRLSFPVEPKTFLESYDRARSVYSQPDPDMSLRDWGNIGRLYSELFENLTKARGVVKQDK